MADLGPHSDPHPDVAGYLLRTLDPDDTQRFADHLGGCHACQRELDELAGIPDLLADVAPSTPLPPGLEERTFVAIEAAAAAGAQEAAAPTAGPPGTVIPISAGAKRRQRRAPLLLLAAAAVIVIGLAVGIVTTTGGSLTAPAATIRLVSVSGGPAHGTAQVRSTPAGLTIDMTVEDLAPSRPGTFYTCWLVGPGDTLKHPNRVSVGSFVVSRTGPVHVHWTTAADPHRFPQLGVTLEPANGNPSHQGPKVLTGTVAV